jgi:hypothetical protein
MRAIVFHGTPASLAAARLIFRIAFWTMQSGFGLRFFRLFIEFLLARLARRIRGPLHCLCCPILNYTEYQLYEPFVKFLPPRDLVGYHLRGQQTFNLVPSIMPTFKHHLSNFFLFALLLFIYLWDIVVCYISEESEIYDQHHIFSFYIEYIISFQCV